MSFEPRSLSSTGLTLSERRFDALVRASAHIVWVASVDGRVEEDSTTWRDFTGQTLNQFLGIGWLDVVHPEDRESTFQVWRQAVKAQTRYETVYRLRHKSGEWRWTSARGSPVFDDHGKIQCWVGLNDDVTEKVNARAALQESETQFRTLAENIPDLVWLADSDAQIYYWNPTWYAFTGRTVAQSLGLDAAQVVREDVRSTALQEWSACVESGRAFEMELPLQNRHGEFEWFLARAKPFKDEAGRIIRWCGVLSNINAQKRCEADLIIERQNRERFVTTLVHDLRNTLAAG